MSKIIPRWEYRVFGPELDEIAKRLEAHECTRVLESSEVYIVSPRSGNNVKIRDGLLDIKTMQNTNADKLEQWMPALKVGFPAPAEEVAKIFTALSLTPPDFARESYSYDEFIAEVVEPCPDLTTVDVFKKRHGYMIRECIVEIADLTFNGKAIRSAAAEHTDAELVMTIAGELGITAHTNTNYIKAMKAAVGMEVS